VGFIERGEREVGVTKVWALADALGVSASELFN
jgi:transcriptional regulator with XRE-family HTH domain